MYDLIIIGAGPAGITAAIYAARKRINFLIISKDVGGQAALSGDVENYTGYQFVTGPELALKFEEHLRKFDIALKENETVVSLEKKDGIIYCVTDKSTYEAKAVIIASGKKSKELNVGGEKEFKNRGLTYCAICDGPLFSNQEVAVIGGGNSALDAAIGLTKIASHIYIVNIAGSLTGDAILRGQVENNKLVTVLNNTRVSAILGGKIVNAIKIVDNLGERVIPVSGVFVEIGLIPNSGFTHGVVKNETGEILVNAFNETNVSGIFAAGDVTNVSEKQIIIAAGEGSKALLCAARYLEIATSARGGLAMTPSE
jgi:NADH-dependent peroxiredoxin subunit F